MFAIISIYISLYCKIFYCIIYQDKNSWNFECWQIYIFKNLYLGQGKNMYTAYIGPVAASLHTWPREFVA